MSTEAHTVGVFLVAKKTPGQLRMILDTRLVNAEFRIPPRANLPSAAAWSRLEVPEGETAFLGQSDIADASYCIKLPPGLSRDFVLPRVS